MRIALALSGLPRIYTISAASWGRIIGRYEPDVYVHSWLENGANEHYVCSQIDWVFKPIARVIEPVPDIDTSPFSDRHWPYIDVYRSLSMWHGIRRAHDMVCQSGIDYDLVIRGRMDLHVHRLELEPFDGVVLPFCPYKLDLKFTYRGKQMHGYNDHLAYGTLSNMTKYCSTLDEILPLYRDEGVDYCPENFLAATLEKNNVSVLQQQLQHQLIRG